MVGLGTTLIQGNYIHDFNASGSPHYDGIQIDGPDSNVTIEHNTVINNQGWTSAVMVTNDLGSVSNITVDNNLLIGGGYTVYVQPKTGAMPNVVVTNNHIGPGQFGDCSAKRWRNGLGDHRQFGDGPR